ncbi:MAG: hypothetical protein H6R15_1836 [Proteobacteria bacterium]|nr:hypothetical protein [Pseudomonadota bacterium]
MAKPLSLLIAAGAVVLAVVLNPSPEKHREKIKEVIAERSQLERFLGLGQLTSFASRYHSFGLGSYTTVDDKLTSIGAFGLVFVPD